jgi:hypothetical protein
MKSAAMGKWAELLWPRVLAFVAALGSFVFAAHIHLATDVQTRLLDKLVDVCAISVGFWATALALLLALEERKTVDALKQIGIYGRVVGYFLGTVYAYFVLLAACLLTIAIGRPQWFPHPLYVATWAFIISLAAGTVLRSFFLLGKLLRAK